MCESGFYLFFHMQTILFLDFELLINRLLAGNPQTLYPINN